MSVNKIFIAFIICLISISTYFIITNDNSSSQNDIANLTDTNKELLSNDDAPLNELDNLDVLDDANGEELIENIDEPLDDENLEEPLDEEPVEEPLEEEIEEIDIPEVPLVEEVLDEQKEVAIVVPSSEVKNPAVNLIENDIYDIVLAAQNYYSNNYSKISLITKNGYLYNEGTKSYVDINFLISTGLSQDYLKYEVEVLLLNSGDVAHYSSQNINDSNDLTVYIYYKDITTNKKYLSSVNNKQISITDYQYNNLLNYYDQNNGEIRRLSIASDKYERILNFIRIYESKYENYFIRSIYVDDLYALVTLSSRSNSNNVTQYILKDNNNIWEVVKADVQNESRPIVSINRKLPTLNLDMIKNYSISNHIQNMNTNFENQIKVLVANNYIAGLDDIFFICGAYNYTYIETNKSARFLIVVEGFEYVIYAVDNGYDAEKKMLAYDLNAPTFIVLDD